jgi:UDP-2,3-diacylglucosamine pyrophosphatase LpxH
MWVDFDGGVKMEFLWAPPGEFMMGSPDTEAQRGDDERQQRVKLSKGFWIGKYEVTNEQWDRVLRSNPGVWKRAKLPVDSVNWQDCQEFIQAALDDGSHRGQLEFQAGFFQFLKGTSSDYLYIVGDLIDGWELKRNWHWEDSYNTLIQKLLRKQRKHTRIIYVTGNHDEFLESFVGLTFGKLSLVKEAIHEAADGRRYLVIHGHQFDGLTQFNRLLERLGSRLYDWVLNLNQYLNRLRRQFGLGYWSFAAFLKSKAKSAEPKPEPQEGALAGMLRRWLGSS